MRVDHVSTVAPVVLAAEGATTSTADAVGARYQEQEAGSHSQ